MNIFQNLVSLIDILNLIKFPHTSYMLYTMVRVWEFIYYMLYICYIYAIYIYMLYIYMLYMLMINELKSLHISTSLKKNTSPPALRAPCFQRLVAVPESPGSWWWMQTRRCEAANIVSWGCWKISVQIFRNANMYVYNYIYVYRDTCTIYIYVCNIYICM